MPANATTLEAQVTALAASPVVKAWSARSGQPPTGFSLRGGSKLTITNVTQVAVAIRRDDVAVADLGGRELLTIGLDPTVSQLVTFATKSDGAAGGEFVLHDTRFDWRLASADAEHQTGFDGPTTLALVNHPRSEFTVQLLAGGSLKASAKPGVAVTVALDAKEAASIVVRRSGGATGNSAQGAICVSDGGR